MRRILCVFVLISIFLPLMVSGAEQKGASNVFKAKDALTASEKDSYDAISYGRLGAEIVYLNKGLTQASFTRTKECRKAYKLYYVCLCQKIARRRPGKCPCGKALVPAIKHAKTWYHLGRNSQGSLIIMPASSVDCCTADMSCKTSCSGCSN